MPAPCGCREGDTKSKRDQMPETGTPVVEESTSCSRIPGAEAESPTPPQNPGGDEKQSQDRLLVNREASKKCPCSSSSQVSHVLLFWKDHEIFCQDSDLLWLQPHLRGLCGYAQGLQGDARSHSPTATFNRSRHRRVYFMSPFI